jgi:hypothetical protein
MVAIKMTAASSSSRSYLDLYAPVASQHHHATGITQSSIQCRAAAIVVRTNTRYTRFNERSNDAAERNIRVAWCGAFRSARAVITNDGGKIYAKGRDCSFVDRGQHVLLG